MKFMLVSAAIAALALPALPSHAAGPYDGNWSLISAPQPGGRDASNPECAEMGIRFQIVDNKIVGSLQNAGSGAVVSGGGTPINGSVNPDGTVNVEWRGVKAAGKITGDKLQMSWSGTCGPRTGTGTRAK
ncbi:MAG TPA: hypothetical protein VGH13_18155 [Xanthobacteraceae bacterium]|jgi:hypothetical protein